MWFHHLYADGASESHWRKVELMLQERIFALPAQGIFVSEAESTKALVFISLKFGWNEPSHRTPKRQILFCLAGSVCVTASMAKRGTLDKAMCGAWRT
jgi:hypothetical protein